MATVDNRFPTEGTQIDIEARLAAIETALASLLADTTGQSIASAISGLGATLGSDKANISGDNIANPSAFRSSIGVRQYIMEYKEIPLTYSSSSNPVAIGSANVAKTGYTPIGIVGWQVSGASSSLVYVPSLLTTSVISWHLL